MLLMKQIFFDAIRSGEKTTTLRYWQRQHVNPGSIEFVPGLGKLRIDDVRKVNFNQLTDDDAQRDGFDTLCDLDTMLDEIYTREQRVTRELFLIQFTLVEDNGWAWKKKKTG